MTRPVTPAAAMFKGASGNTLVGDVYGEEGPPVLLLHGGGQTRHAWKKTGDLIARMGRIAYAVDQRGHGDSEWVADGAYQYTDFAADARVLADTLAERGGVRPAVVGASLGGMAALIANCQPTATQKKPQHFSALVLVDITPRVDVEGVSKIQGFMRAQLREGFGSIAEAADAVAAYLPHRPRPRSHEGLKKNLRLHPDGRWRWHWDPRFLEGNRRIGAGSGEVERALVEAARASPSRRCWCAAPPRNWCRRSTPRISSALCRTRPMSMSAAPATWSPATATISSQMPLRSSCRTLEIAS